MDKILYFLTYLVDRRASVSLKTLDSVDDTLQVFKRMVKEEEDKHVQRAALGMVKALRAELKDLRKKVKGRSSMQLTAAEKQQWLKRIEEDGLNLQTRIVRDTRVYKSASQKVADIKDSLAEQVWTAEIETNGIRPPLEFMKSYLLKKLAQGSTIPQDTKLSVDDSLGLARLNSMASSYIGGLDAYEKTKKERQAFYAKLAVLCPLPHSWDAEEALKFDPDRQKWRKGDLVGRGTFGKVFTVLEKGQDNSTALVVVKEIPINRPSWKERVKKECMLVAKNIRHPNVVTFIDYRELYDMKFLLFMEYVSGGTLYDRIQWAGRMTEIESKPMLRQILEGIKHLHDIDIIHRDIKSPNILWALDGCIKISDLGTAKELAGPESQEQSQLEETESLLSTTASNTGTLPWMPPEAVSRDMFTTRMDIWSFGCVMVETFTGKIPWVDLACGSGGGLRSKLLNMQDADIEGPPLLGGGYYFESSTLAFLQRIFVEESQRPSARELLADPWLQSNPDETY